MCAVVPISSVEPKKEVDFVVRLEFEDALPKPFDFPVVWAKCDMISTVCFERLDLFRSGRDQYGKRKYIQPNIGRENLLKITEAVKCGLGF